jgi:hypothetical protein
MTRRLRRWFYSAASPTSPAAALLADTWIWNGVTQTWTQQNPAASPSGRWQAAITYNAPTGTVVLFAGIAGNYYTGGFLDDTWTWNGTNWTQQFPASSPPPLNTPEMAYDPDLGLTLLFGGALTNASEYQNILWTWNGSNWGQLSPSGGLPPGRAGFGMTYQSVSKGVLIFGGNGSANNVFGGNDTTPLGDTWLLTP